MKFLIIENDEKCREEIRLRLNKEFLCSAVREVGTESQYQAALADGPYDMIVADAEPGWAPGLDIVRDLKERWPRTPVVMVARGSREPMTMDVIRAGVDDCLISGHLDCLPFAVKESIEKARLRRERDDAIVQRKDAEKRCRELDEEIASRLESGQELERTTSELRAIFQALPDLYFRMASDGTILEYRAGRYSDLYVPPEAFLGKRMQEVLPTEVGAQFLESIRQLQSKGTMVSYEYALPASGGELQFFEARLLPLVEDQVVAVVRNITERKRSEQELSRLAAAIECSADGVVIVDLDGTIQYANPVLMQLTGYSRHDLVGKDVAVLFRGEEAGSLLAEMWEVLKKGLVWSGRASGTGRGGGPLELEQRFYPIWEASRNAIGYVGVMRDISHEQAVEAQLLHAQKMEAIGQLAGGVAHDFNNILVSIIGFAELLMNELSQESPLREDVGEIVKAADRGAALARQVMVFSRRQAGHVEVLDLNVLIAGLEPMLRRLIGEDINLVTSLDPDVGHVRGDAGQLEQLVVNLALNARNSMPTGGVLTIESGNTEVDAAFSSQHVAVGPGRYVRLTVSDTGRPMREQAKALLMEPFPRAGQPEGEEAHGLSTVCAIVSQHGGAILVSGEKEGGNLCSVYLPRVPISAQGTVPQKGESVSGGSETVLVVEDEDSVRELARRILESKGYTVLIARNGMEALDICRRYVGTIHLLLTDVIMPEMSGRQLAERLLGERPDIKVMFMSGYSAEIIVNRGVLDGGTAYIEKPFRHDELAGKVRRTLDER